MPLQLLDILCGNAVDSTIVLLTGPVLARVILDAIDAAIAAFEVYGATGALAKVIQQQAAATSKEKVPAFFLGYGNIVDRYGATSVLPRGRGVAYVCGGGTTICKSAL